MLDLAYMYFDRSPALAAIWSRPYITLGTVPELRKISLSTSEEWLARTKRHVWAVLAAEEANTRTSLPMCTRERDTKNDRRARRAGRVELYMDLSELHPNLHAANTGVIGKGSPRSLTRLLQIAPASGLPHHPLLSNHLVSLAELDDISRFAGNSGLRSGTSRPRIRSVSSLPPYRRLCLETRLTCFLRARL